MLEKPNVCSRGHIFYPIITKLDQHVCLDAISHKFENGSKTGSKTGSPGQILKKKTKKPCVHSRGHIFSLIFMKLSQNFCLDEILYMFKNGSCWVKK